MTSYYKRLMAPSRYNPKGTYPNIQIDKNKQKHLFQDSQLDITKREPPPEARWLADSKLSR